VSVLVVEQFATVGLRYATEAYVMAHGTVTFAGPAAQAESAIQRAYLGVGG
jgi:ABC-type branched-subunit amino acid transport system ATPase component